jgi:hypothetical protein
MDSMAEDRMLISDAVRELDEVISYRDAQLVRIDVALFKNQNPLVIKDVSPLL